MTSGDYTSLALVLIVILVGLLGIDAATNSRGSVDDEKQSTIAVAKEEEALARLEWLRSINALGESLNNEALERADQARIALKAAEKKLAQLEGRE